MLTDVFLSSVFGMYMLIAGALMGWIIGKYEAELKAMSRVTRFWLAVLILLWPASFFFGWMIDRLKESKGG